MLIKMFNMNGKKDKQNEEYKIGDINVVKIKNEDIYEIDNERHKEAPYHAQIESESLGVGFIISGTPNEIHNDATELALLFTTVYEEILKVDQENKEVIDE